MRLTDDEYAAIGRRVAITGDKNVPYDCEQARDDRAALWDLCERLMERHLAFTGYSAKCQPPATPYTAAVAALLESLGGTDD